MLGLFSKKADHPLAELKSAQEALAEVPKEDAVAAVQEITGWLESLADHQDEFKFDHYFTVLRMFDEAAQPHLRKLTRDFFAVQPLSKFQENRLWTVLGAYYEQSEMGFLHVLRGCRQGGRGASAVKPFLPQLGVRGVAALGCRLKFLAARYALVESELWGHLAEFYAHAESQGYQNSETALYVGAPGETSVAREFALLVVWYGLSAGTLTPVNEHIAERILSHLSRSFRVSKRFEEGGMFAFDLSQPTPPMRASAESTITPSLRIVIEGDVLTQLENISRTLEKDMVPEEINFWGGSYDAVLVGDVVKYLVAGFTLPPPTRRNPRRKISVNLHVANGFFKMLEHTGISLNFGQVEADETWDVEDISVTGFRSVIPLKRADGVKIGSLVGTRPENVAHWGAGIVRRLRRDENDNLHIGVEVLTNQIVGVTLTERLNSHEGEQAALYLSRPNDNSGEAWLLMRPDTFSASHSLNMLLNGKRYLLMPLARVESGEDYDLVRYRMMLQDMSAPVSEG